MPSQIAQHINCESCQKARQWWCTPLIPGALLGGQEFHSRFILGSGKYSLDLIQAAVEHAGAQIITLALRRANAGGTANILDYIPDGVTLLPNTSGARTADEAVRIARLAREVGCGNFVKIEIMRDSKYLLPDNYETVMQLTVDLILPT